MNKMRVLIRGGLLVLFSVVFLIVFLQTGNHLFLGGMIGLVLVLIAVSAHSYYHRAKYELSSSLHIIFRWIIPLLVVMVIVYVLRTLLISEVELEKPVRSLLLYSTIALSLGLILYLYFFSRRLVYAMGDDDGLILRQFPNISRVRFTEIERIEKGLFVYVIVYKTSSGSKKGYILPSYVEMWIQLIGTGTNSIEKYKSSISLAQ